MQTLLLFTTFSYYFFASVQGDCSSDRDRGNDTCSGAVRSLRWYFNPKKLRCMAFTYWGCDGNDNNFESLDACQAECQPALKLQVNGYDETTPVSQSKEPKCMGAADGLTCFSAAYSPPSPMTVGASGLRWCKFTGCPLGYECRSGGLISQCCHTATETWFKEGQNPKCRNGKTALQHEGNVVVADSCSDLSCPEGYVCEITNQLFAKCC